MAQRRMAPCGALAALALLTLAGCASVPRPSSVRDSLLVILSEPATSAERPTADSVVIDGPTPIRANLLSSSNGVLAFRVSPGTYVLHSRSMRWGGGAAREFSGYRELTVEVPPATIVLPFWKFAAVRPGEASLGASVARVTAEDRRHAATELADYVRTAEWAGRNVRGFAPYSPFTDYAQKRFAIKIVSTPSDATLLIDHQDWGRTPLSVSLAPGRHFVSLSHPGFVDATAFIDVGGNGSESFTLKPVQASEAAAAHREIALMIEPFENLGAGEYDSLAGALTSSLYAALRNSGVRMVGTAAKNDPSPSGSAAPDFAAAQEAGAEAFVAGDYLASQDSILIHAALYDTRTRLVKASLLFDGKAGLSLFDSIDRMSRQFGSSLEKALPEVGQPVVQERVISPASVGFSRRLAEQEVIQKRNARPYSLSIGPSLVGVLDQISVPSSSGSNTISRINGPALGAYVGFNAPIRGPIGLHLATTPFTFTDPGGARRIEVPFYFGPRYTFSGFMSDVYFGLQGALHYAPAVTFTPSGLTSSVTEGPFILAGVNFETGLRIYTYQRTSRLPSYLGLGLTMGFFGYRFDIAHAVPPQPYPMEIELRVLWGTRL